LCVTGKLDVFLGDVRRVSANLNVGSVGLVNPRHRVLILAAVVVVMLVVVTTAHPLVLTVSHDSPVCCPLALAVMAALLQPLSTLAATLLARPKNRVPPDQMRCPNYGTGAAISDIVSRSSNPLPATFFAGVAHLSSCATPRRSPIAGGA
jgi:hypothetical protein